jgi:hypothetical protein
MKRAALALRIALALVVAASAHTSRARADDTTEQARVYFDAGAQAYAAGRYPVAIEAFASAYRLAMRPAILFSMAQAERKQFWIDKKPAGIARAIRHYRDYLAAVPEGGRRDDAATALSELEPFATRLEAAGGDGAAGVTSTATRLLVSSRAPNATAAIDNEPAASLPRLVDIAGGTHHIAVTAPGFFPDARDVIVLQGVTTPVELNLREQPGHLTVDTAPETGATVRVDGREVGTTPFAQPVEVASGTHVLTVSSNGRQLFRDDVTIERGRDKTVTAHLVVTRQRRISEVVAGVGGVGFVTAGVFLAVSLGEQSAALSIHDQRQHGNITGSQLTSYDSELSARDTWRTASLATMSGALGVLVAGGSLYLFDHPQSESAHHGAEPSPSLTPMGPAGCGCGIEVSVLPTAAPGYAGAAIIGRF